MKFKYSLELLHSTIERDHAVLLSNHDRVQKRTIILFRCECGEEGHKTAAGLIKGIGAFCKKCSVIKGVEKTKQTNFQKTGKNLICSIQALHDVIERDRAVLLT